MAEAGAYSEARTGNWLWTLLVGAILLTMEFILFAALVPASWSEQVRDTELPWLQKGLGARTANAVVERTERWYGTLFVAPNGWPKSRELLELAQGNPGDTNADGPNLRAKPKAQGAVAPRQERDSLPALELGHRSGDP